MNNVWKRSLSLMMALFMVFSMMPMQALAAETTDYAVGDTVTVSGSTAQPTGTIPTGSHWEGPVKGSTICGKIEHTHSDSCYDKVLSCEHSHVQSCYTEYERCYTAGYGCSHEFHYSEGSGLSKKYYGSSTLICAHTHTDDCYSVGSDLGSGCPTRGFILSSFSYTYYEHTHTEPDCYEYTWTVAANVYNINVAISGNSNITASEVPATATHGSDVTFKLSATGDSANNWTAKIGDKAYPLSADAATEVTAYGITSGDITVELTSAPVPTYSVSLVENGKVEGCSASLSATTDLLPGATSKVTVSLPEATANTKYSYAVSVSGEGASYADGVVTVGNADVTVTVTYSTLTLTGNASANVKFNPAKSIADQLDALKQEIFSKLGVAYSAAAISWSDVTIQYYPWADAVIGSDDYDDEALDLTAEKADDTILNQTVVDYKCFGERGVGATEKVIIIYNGLSIEATITLIDGRLALPAFTADGVESTGGEAAIKSAAAAAVAGTFSTLTADSFTVESGWADKVNALAANEVAKITVTAEYAGDATYRNGDVVVTVPVTKLAQASTITVSESADHGDVSITTSSGSEVEGSSFADTLTITVVPDTANGYYVESVTVNNGDVAMTDTWGATDTTYTGTFAIANDSAYEVFVTYGQVTVDAAEGTIKVNKYYAKNGNAKALENLKTNILTAAGLTGEYTVTTTVSSIFTAVVSDTGATGESTGTDLSGALALAMANDSSRPFTITVAADGHKPAVSKTITMKIEDSRPVAEITVGEDLSMEFDTTAEIDAYIAGLVSASYSDTAIEADVAYDLAAIKTDAANDGTAQTVQVSVTVAETADYQAAAKEFSLSVTGKVHKASVAVTNDNAMGTVSGLEAEYDSKTARSVTVTVEPTGINYVESVTVNGDKIEGTYANTVFTGSFDAVNGDDKTNTYEVVVTYGQRDFTVEHSEIEVNFYAEDMAKTAFATAKVSATGYDYEDFTVATEGTAEVGKTITYTVTLNADDKYPAVTKEISVTFVDERTEWPLTLSLEVESLSISAFDDALESVLKDLVKVETTAAAYEITLNAEEFAALENLKQGESATVTATVTIEGNTVYESTEESIEITVIGKIEDAVVKLEYNAEHGTAVIGETATASAENTYPAGTYVVTMVPGTNYFIYNLKVVKNGEEIANYVISDFVDGKVEVEIENGKGLALGVVPEYTLTAAFVDPSITISDSAVVTYYGQDAKELPEDILEDVKPEYAPEELVEGAVIDTDPTVTEQAENELTVYYLAREAGTFTETITINLPVIGNQTFTVDIPAGDQWLEISQEIPTGAGKPSQEEIQAEINELLEKYSWSDLISMGTDGLKALVKTEMSEMYEEYYRFYNAHNFGMTEGSTETIKIVYNSPIYGVVESNTAVITLQDDRTETEIRLNEGVEMTYGFTADELYEALVDGVYANGTKIEGAKVEFITAIEGMNASDEAYTIQVSYAGTAGTDGYKHSAAEATIMVNKASVDVFVDNRLVKYGTAYEMPVGTTPAGVSTIKFIVGLDVSDINVDGGQIKGIMGDVQLMLPAELQSILENVGLKSGVSMTISELKGYLDSVGQLFTGSEYEEAINVLLNMINSLPTETADIKVTVGGQLPSNIGIYLVGAVSADGNYETDFGVGVIAITPDGNKAEIDWVMEDENHIITRTLLTEGIFDTSAEAISLAEGGDLDAATAQVVEVFLGLDLEGNIILETDQTKLNVGAYTEVAMIVNWGNTMYYSEPIARAFVVVAESLNVDFIDSTGAVNNERRFVFDNEAQSEMENVLVTYKQNGNGYAAGDKVENYTVTYFYVGTQTNGIPYASKSAPVHAGAYTVTAVAVARDAAGEISHVGVGVGAMVIEPAVSSITVETKAVPYADGKSYGTTDMVNATSAVAGLTPDSTVITAGITTDHTFGTNGLSAIVGTANVDMPAWLDEIFTKYGILEAGYTESGITVETLLSYVQKIQDQLTELGIETDAFDGIIDVVEQLPAKTSLTFFDNASYSSVGAYLVIGVVTDSDHYPSVAAGVLVIYPDVTEVELKFEEDWNGNNIFTWNALQVINLDAKAYDLGTDNVNEAATEKVTNIYLGVNDNGEIVLTTDKSTLDNGAYTQIAVLLDLGSEMYYAEPITRAFVIVPNPATVEFIDENGNVNDERLFTFDNKQHGMDVRVTVDGKVVENPGENLIVTYVGAQSNLEAYSSSEAPVHTGVYAVTALYTAKDAQDRIVTLGASVGTLVIAPAESSTEVSNKIHAYDGTAVSVADMVKVSSAVEGITPNATIISAAINTDGTFSENLAGAITGSINIDLPAWVDAYIAKSGKLADGVTVAGALAELEKLEAELAEIGEELNVLTALTAVLEQLPGNAALTFNDNISYNAVGAYLVVAVVTDSNHYPSMDAGFLVIHPTVEFGELAWKNVDSNNIFYLDSLVEGYLDAKYVGDETVDPTELYLGVDADNWLIHLSKEQPDTVGIYTELAYLIDNNSNAHYALPIIRPVIVVDGIYDVLFYDENGNVNHDRLFTYNGEAQPIGDIFVYGYGKNFYADAVPAEDSLVVRYIGTDVTGDGWFRTTPPTDAGAYTVIAIYTDYDENGAVIGGGAGVGTMVIAKADLALDMVDTTVTYDGNEHFINVTSNDENADYLTAIVDKEANTINFILEDDLTIAGGVMKVLLEKALGRELDGSFTVTEVQQAMHQVIDSIQNYEIPEEIAAVADKLPENLQNALRELKASTYNVVKAELDTALESLQSVMPQSGTVIFNGKLPVNAGTYQFYGFALSENYEPEVTKGILTIEKATVEAPEIASKVYNGETQIADVAESDLYVVTENNGGVNVGGYDVVLTLTDSKNYKWADTEEAELTRVFEITKAEDNGWITEPSIEGWTYGDEPNVPTAEAKYGEIKVEYRPADSTDADFTTEVPTDAGDYIVRITVEGTDNYDGLTVELELTIAKAESSVVTDPVAVDGLVYNGESQELITAGSAQGGELVYSLSENGPFTSEIPVGTDAGTYTIYCKVAGDENHNDSAVKSITVSIVKAIPEYEVPTGLTAIEGQTLADVKLPEGFTWEDAETTSVGGVGTNSFYVIFTPEDTDNYETVRILVTILVTEDTSKDGLYPIVMNADHETIYEGVMIYVDGVGYELDSNLTAYVPMDSATFVTTYVYNVESDDPHDEYPTHMYVWQLTFHGVEDGEWDKSENYTADRIEKFDDIMQYSGSSIRMSGKKGIRMITSIPTATRNTLIKSSLCGYRLIQTGTCVEWADEEGNVFNSLTMETNPKLVGYAYKRGVQDPVFNRTNGLDQFTNVLVGFSNEQCKDDLVMRPYMILENVETGEQVVLYGGAVQRSIGYIAYQNRFYKPNQAAYDFIWDIIRYVYGDMYDADYQG